MRFPLKFVYVEPYVIPKQSLTGNNSERVDTRVLQVIYELPEERPVDVYIGQQMDVYLKAVPPSHSVDGDHANLPFEERMPAQRAPEARRLTTPRSVARKPGNARNKESRRRSSHRLGFSSFEGSIGGITRNLMTCVAGVPLAISSWRISVRS